MIKKSEMHVVNDIARAAAAQRLVKTYTANIEFLKERLRIQSEPGFNKWFVSGWATIPGRTYTQFDLEEMEAKLAKAQAVLNEYK